MTLQRRSLRSAPAVLNTADKAAWVTCQIYGHVVGACVECNTHIEAQQVAVPVPLTDGEIDAVTIAQWGEMHGQPLAAHRAFARAIEAMLAAAPKGDAPCNAYGSYSFGG